MPGERTEKPTPRRIDKARREGNLPASRELIGAGQFVLFVVLLSAWSIHVLAGLVAAMRSSLRFGHSPELDTETVTTVFRLLSMRIGFPILAAGALMMVFAVGVQLAISRFGFALKKVAPDFARLNPMRRLKSLPGQNIPAALQAMILIPLCLYVVWQLARDNLQKFIALEFAPPAAGFSIIASSVQSLLWKAAVILLAVGVVDLVRQKHSWTKQLMMSRQEVREELKETEGNPQIKLRIRRIQRDLARRRMMQEIPKATALIVNPTHYSVAIRYEMGSMGAPRVVAKGKNYLALRIRQIALEHQVPIVENRPLAQGLYKSVDVGQEIPAHLYKAVAEILAYIYRLMNPKGRLA